MAKKKKRINLYLTVALYERAKALTELVPGMSVSALVDEMLEQSLEMYEELFSAMAETAKEGNRDTQGEIMERLLADQLLAFAREGNETIHTIKSAGAERGTVK